MSPHIPAIAYCGHHCQFCFFKDCTGCRSENPTCSFANLFEDRQCPNVVCCRQKGIDGCYECADLAKCTHGFYGRKEEPVAKATALFIRKHGKDKYHRALSNSIRDGVDYPQRFNKLDSIPAMIALLEAHL